MPPSSSSPSSSSSSLTWTERAAEAGAELPAGADKLVVYDGVCQLCDGTVKFLIARDPARVFHFVALQSAAAAPVLRAFGLSRDEALSSIVFVDARVAYRKSAAALRIATYLPAPYRWLHAAACVPALLRDAVYDCVATHRYRIFGQSEDCMRPTADIRARFLDADELGGASGRSKSKAS